MKFPTAIAPGGFGTADIDAADKPYLFEGAPYLVGDLAAFSTSTLATRNIGFLMKLTPLILHTVLERLNLNGSPPRPTVGLGLPLEHLRTHRQELINRTTRFLVDNHERTLSPRVFPQGGGVLMNFLLDRHGQPRDTAPRNIIVLDIGFNTVDVVVARHGQPIRDESYMLDRQGVSRIVDMLRARLAERGVVVDEQQAKSALETGALSFYGKQHDLRGDIHELKTRYSATLFNNVAARSEPIIRKLDRFVLAGGGAYYVTGHVPAEWTQMAYTMQYREFANARGFLKGLRVRTQ